MGRPKGSKNKPKEIVQTEPIIKKKRGRPPKIKSIENPILTINADIKNEIIEPVIKKKRGRPPKIKSIENPILTIKPEIIEPVIKKKRGRPSKPKPIKRKYKFIKEMHGCGYYEAPRVICKYENGNIITQYDFIVNPTRLTKHKENSIIKVKGKSYTFLRYDETEEDLIYILEDMTNGED